MRLELFHSTKIKIKEYANSIHPDNIWNYASIMSYQLLNGAPSVDVHKMDITYNYAINVVDRRWLHIHCQVVGLYTSDILRIYEMRRISLYDAPKFPERKFIFNRDSIGIVLTG